MSAQPPASANGKRKTALELALSLSNRRPFGRLLARAPVV